MPNIASPLGQTSFALPPGPQPFNQKPWSNPIRYPLNRQYGRDFTAYTGRTSGTNPMDRNLSIRGFTTPSTNIVVPGGGQPIEVFHDTLGCAIYWAAPSGDFEILVEFTGYLGGIAEMIGPMIVDSSGAGVGCSSYNNPGALYTWVLSGWAYQSTGNPTGGAAPFNQPHLWYALKKSGTSYTARVSTNGTSFGSATTAVTSAITPAYIGFGRFYNETGGWYRLYRFNVYPGPTFFPG